MKKCSADTSKTETPDAGATPPPGFEQISPVDCHLHFYDFLQESDGLESLVRAMDKAGIARAVLFGLPMAKHWNEHSPLRPLPAYMYNDGSFYHCSATDYRLMLALERAAPEMRNRFYPFVCGLNTTDLNAAKHLEHLLQEFSGRIFGIGELMSRHDDLTAMTWGEPVRASHPAFKRISDIAAEASLPMLVHHNIAESYREKSMYLAEMEDLLRHNARTSIIWAHIGTSRHTEVNDLREAAEAVLHRHNNLFFDISWLVLDRYILKSEQSVERWCSLFEQYPEHFLFGTDVVGHWKDYHSTVRQYDRLYALLTEKTRRRIWGENMRDLLPPLRETVDPGQQPCRSPADSVPAV